MPNITLNLCQSEGTVQRRTPAETQRRKNKKFRKRMRYLEKKEYLEDKQKYNHHGGHSTRNQAPRHNGACSERPPPPGASTQNKSLPHPDSASHCSSFRPSPTMLSLPSRTCTVNSKGNHETPASATTATPNSSGPSRHKPTAKSAVVPNKYLAMDCEMVGVGPKGRVSQLARCSIVSYEGDVVYDKFINPSMPVTDYRTRWSGIRRSDLVRATPYPEARKEILRLLMGKVVIGHAVHNDFKVLSYSHPAALTRDTSRIPLLNQKAGFAENECASLKRLTKAIFNRDIQTGRRGHSSVEDARATMELYKVVEVEWEQRLASKQQPT